MLRKKYNTFDISKYLVEATNHSSFMSKREAALKKQLEKILRDDGHGHHHAKYAERLKIFDINIVPIKHRIQTAAISFEELTIYINEGFLRDPKTFYQLGVIIRHELLHNLLMHQVRMQKYLSQLDWAHISMSSSIHDVLNILEDFEISNRYTDFDKEVVRNTWINGHVISGLVVDDHRESWMKMPLEQMYDAFIKELEDMGWTGELSGTGLKRSDGSPQMPGNLEIAAMGLMKYKNIQEPSEFSSVDELINEVFIVPSQEEDPSFSYDDIPSEWKEIIEGAQKPEKDPNVGYSEKDFVDMLQQIARTTPMEKCDLTSPATRELLVTLWTPEEKLIASEILKISAGYTTWRDDYQRWYQEMLDTVGPDTELSEEDIKELLNCLE